MVSQSGDLHVMIYPFILYGITVWGSACNDLPIHTLRYHSLGICMLWSTHSYYMVSQSGDLHVMIYPFILYGITVWGSACYDLPIHTIWYHSLGICMLWSTHSYYMVSQSGDLHVMIYPFILYGITVWGSACNDLPIHTIWYHSLGICMLWSTHSYYMVSQSGDLHVIHI